MFRSQSSISEEYHLNKNNHPVNVTFSEILAVERPNKKDGRCITKLVQVKC